MTNIITIKGFTNNFLVKIQEGYLLVDSFLPIKYKRFLRTLKRKRIKLNEIKYVFLTHHHVDHSACLTKLRKKINFTLITHKRAISFLKKGDNEEYTKPLNYPAKIIMPLVKKILGVKYTPVEIMDNDIIIEEDTSDVLREKLNLNAQVIRTPGSTDDNLSIIFDDGKTITGDIVTNFLHIFAIKNRPPLITTMEEVFNSWDILIKNGAKFLYPSHGKPLTIQQLINRRTKLRK